MLLSQLRDGVEERISAGAEMGGAHKDCRLGSGWAPGRENEGGTEALRQG